TDVVAYRVDVTATVLPVDSAVPCTGGGSAHLGGELDGADSGGVGTYSAEVTTSFSACNIGHGVTLDGSVPLVTTGSIAALDDHTVEMSSITYIGELVVNGKSCKVDVTVSAGFETGEICDDRVNYVQ